jgi:hypothetical protein
MDNNSNDTLFGFEAISDMFTEGAGLSTNNDDELTDEQLEELKQNSAKNRPATPASKQKETEEEEVEEEETEEEEEEVEEEPVTKTKSTKTTKVVEEEESDDEEPEETSQVTALFDAIAEELDWEFSDDEKDDKPKTVEGLVNYFKDVIQEQSVPQYASEEVAKIDEFVRNGGKLTDYFTIDPELDLDNLDTTIESNQKQVVKMLLIEKGYNDRQISRKIEKYEDAGILEDEAEDAVEALKDINEKKKEKLLEDQKKEYAARAARQQEFVDNVVGEINSLDNVRGIKVPEKDKKALLAYIFKADADGRTQYQKDYSKSVKNLIESAYFTMKGDTLLDTAKKMGTSSAIKNLKQSLRSTGISKGTKRINTTSSNSIFSRAVQLL